MMWAGSSSTPNGARVVGGPLFVTAYLTSTVEPIRRPGCCTLKPPPPPSPRWQLQLSAVSHAAGAIHAPYLMFNAMYLLYADIVHSFFQPPSGPSFRVGSSGVWWARLLTGAQSVQSCIEHESIYQNSPYKAGASSFSDILARRSTGRFFHCTNSMHE